MCQRYSGCHNWLCSPRVHLILFFTLRHIFWSVFPSRLCHIFGRWWFFLGLTATAYGAAAYKASGSLWIVVAAFGFPAILPNLLAGQNAMLTAAILGLGLTLMERRPRLAGLILGLMVIKPQLALMVPVGLMAFGRWTVLSYAALSALVLMFLSLALFGWRTWEGFFAITTLSRHLLEFGDYKKFQSAFALVRTAGFGILAGYSVQGALAVVATLILFWSRRQRPSLAIQQSLIVLTSLLVTPYLHFYDPVILAFPLIWILVEWLNRGFPPAGKIVLLAVYLSPFGYLFLPTAHLCLLAMLGILIYIARVPGALSEVDPETWTGS
jgi:hypothetical protein